MFLSLFSNYATSQVDDEGKMPKCLVRLINLILLQERERERERERESEREREKYLMPQWCIRKATIGQVCHKRHNSDHLNR